MPKSSFISRKRSSANIKYSRSSHTKKQSDDESTSSASSKGKVLTNKQAVVTVQRCDADYFDYDGESSKLCDDEIETFFQNLQSKLKEVVKAKNKKGEDLILGKFQMRLREISDQVQSVEVKTRKCSDVFEVQHLEIMSKVQKEQEKFSEHIDKFLTIVEQLQRSLSDYKVMQQRNLESLNTISTCFSKTILNHIEEFQEQSKIPIKSLNKEVQLLQGIITKKTRTSEMKNMKSLNSFLW